MSTSVPVLADSSASQPKIVLGTNYQFSNHKKSVTISYSTERKGPPPSEYISAATVSYTGPEGDLKFEGSQIQSLTTPMGTLLSVVLKENSITGSTTLSLFLPPISFGLKDVANFTTYVVKTQVVRQLVAGLTAADLSYEVESLAATASEVIDQGSAN